MRKRRSDPFAPIVAPLIEKRFHEQPTRVAQDGDEQEDAKAAAGDRQPLLAKIDLELLARRGLDPDRRERRRRAARGAGRRRRCTVRSLTVTCTCSASKRRTTTALPAAAPV